MVEYRNIMFQKEDAIVLKSAADRFQYHSISEYIMALNAMRVKLGLMTKLDIEIIVNYGMEGYQRIQNMSTVKTAKSEEEMHRDVSLGKDAKKIADSEGKPFTQTFPKVIAEVKPKKKQKKRKKKSESIEYFKGIEKPKE